MLKRLFRMLTLLPLIQITTANPKPEKTPGYSQFNNGFDLDVSGLNGGIFNAGDPVSMSTGVFHFTKTWLDLGHATSGLPLNFTLHYASDSESNIAGQLPSKFISNHTNIRLLEVPDFAGRNFVTIQGPLGSQLRFRETKPGSGLWRFNDNEEVEYQLHETADFFYLVHPTMGNVFIFEKTGTINNATSARLVRVENRNGNSLVYRYENDRLESLTDGQGRTLNFTYADFGGESFLTEVADHTTRKIQLVYEEDPADNTGLVTLRKIIDARGGETVYTYDKNHRITSVELPGGNKPYIQTYRSDETDSQTLTQTDAMGRVMTFEKRDPISGLGDTHMVLTNPDNNEEHYHHSNNGSIMSALTDALGHTATWKADANNRNRITEITDRDGHSVKLTYHAPSGALASETDENGRTTSYLYQTSGQAFSHPDDPETITATFFDLIQITHPDDTTHEATFDASGNLLTQADRTSDTITYAYDARGRPLTLTNPVGGTVTLTYGANGLPATLATSDIGSHALSYDSLHRLNSVTNPDASTVTMEYDVLDRITRRTNEEGHIMAYTYDANSNLTTLTAAQGTPSERNITFAYNDLDRLVTLTNPSGEIYRYNYDYHPQVKTVTLPDNAIITNTYDARRELVSVTNPIGGIFQYERQPSALLKKITTPEGRATSVIRDRKGLVKTLTDSSGDSFGVKRDSLDRVISRSDGLQRISSVTRDGEGRIAGLEEPIVGNSAREYDGNSRLTRLTDTRGNDWNFTFTDMGRRQSITDPEGNTETRSYDNRGRLQTISYPDGITETRAYFPDSTLQSRTFSDGLVHTFAYDELNRPTTVTRQLGPDTETCIHQFDTRSNRTSTSVNGNVSTATFDSRSRLKTVTYPGGMIVTYTYDLRGLITRVEDNLTNSFIEIDYNDDSQIVKMTRSNGRVTENEYDIEGLPTEIKHDTGATLNMIFNRADEPTRIDKTGFPTDGSGALTNDATTAFVFNSNNEITNGGFTYDERGRPNNCTWDSDNRLLAVNNGPPVSYRYDAFGQITSRSESGTKTEYLYNAAIRRNPIIGEKEGASFPRFYVALPTGEIIYHIDDPEGTPSVHFHHHGQTGNVRFLTNASGAITDSYAYDAYGRLLEKNGTSSQFYTYVGKLGVRTDEAAGLLHMRERYYDPGQARFLSRDPIFLSLMERDGLHGNPYHYTVGQPTWRVDPSGLDSEDDDFVRAVNEPDPNDPGLFPEIEGDFKLDLLAFLIEVDLWAAGRITDPESEEALDLQARDIARVYHQDYKEVRQRLEDELEADRKRRKAAVLRNRREAAARFYLEGHQIISNFPSPGNFPPNAFDVGLDGRLVRTHR